MRDTGNLAQEESIEAAIYPCTGEGSEGKENTNYRSPM